MFNKRKKLIEIDQKAKEELLLKEQMEEQERLKKQQEDIERLKNLEKEAQKIPPYKFSNPDPEPRELISVLKSMLKRLFPDARKAYLVLSQCEDKKGYLLVVDIDVRFIKIINIYLDGETKKVRGDMPIECVAYSKAGVIVESIPPFYKKTLSEAVLNAMSNTNPNPYAEIEGIDMDLKGDAYIQDNIIEDEVINEQETTDENSEDEVSDKTQENTEQINEEEQDFSDDTEDKQTEFDFEKEDEIQNTQDEDLNEDKPIVVPETKTQLFALINRVGTVISDDEVKIAKDGFSEYTFYIPSSAQKDGDDIIEKIDETFSPSILISTSNQTRAIAFFTDEESAVKYSDEKNVKLYKTKYKDYKKALSTYEISMASCEGIIINPTGERILLAPDFVLL